MNIILVGMNHKTAPLEIREKLSLSCWSDLNPLTELMKVPHVKEAMYLSTCNRVEVLAETTEAAAAAVGLRSFIFNHGNLTPEEMGRCLYVHTDIEAIRHLFRVSSSLDSLVMGEPQILGQVKDAYHLAMENKTTGMVLNKLVHHAFRAAKRVRTETAIASNAVSISYAAVELAKKIFGNLQGKTVLLVGAGEMAELAARHLLNQGVGKVLIANRTYTRALEIAAAVQGTAIEFNDLAARLEDADIVISSTGAPGYVVTRDMVAEALRGRKNRLLFLIDIAVPRDIEPEVGELDNAFLYNVDDLQEVVDDNLQNRRQEAEKAEAIIEEEVKKCQAWVNSLLVVPTIVSLRQKVEEIVKSELDKSSSWLGNLDEQTRKNVEIMTTAIVNKIIHSPIASLKEESQDDNGLTSSLVLVRRLFKLDTN
ncbi:MAG: glutamyl-tRNA reductase [Syntrophales bacterium]